LTITGLGIMRTLLLLALSSVAFPQVRTAVMPEISTTSLPLNLPAQKIGPNDLIAVSVYDSPEFTRAVRVGADGQIRFPMLKTKINAQGALPSELETVIAEALIFEDLIVDPFVTVGVVEYASRPINVTGAVRRPLTFQAVGPVTLLDAIARAEGLGPDAGPEILVSRPGSDPSEDGGRLIQRIPVKTLMEASDPLLNIKLEGGEEIRIPEVGKVFVVGNVRKPGAFPVQDVSETTVLKMLAMSEGLMPFASKQAYIYRRESATGPKNEIAIELKKIMDRKSPDVPLMANDILYIPDNTGRRTALTALEKIVSFGSAAGAGVLVYRR
jgi:polysaccharide export outer membrane protein